jgi:hypothetical protein
MDTLGRMRKLGFRKWYERQLIEGHLYLTTCFLGIIAVASSLELFSWERYKRIMLVAEHIGDHAHCPACNAYAKFSVVDAGRALHEEPANIEDPKEVWLKVSCRKCGEEWTI